MLLYLTVHKVQDTNSYHVETRRPADGLALVSEFTSSDNPDRDIALFHARHIRTFSELEK